VRARGWTAGPTVVVIIMRLMYECHINESDVCCLSSDASAPRQVKAERPGSEGEGVDCGPDTSRYAWVPYQWV
jgi:hypothetical protein